MACFASARLRALSALAVFGLLATSLVFSPGCKEAESIRTYSVEHAPLPEPTHRMLAAIVPNEEQKEAYFFKVIGTLDDVERFEEDFDRLIESVRVGAGERPEWKLPEGWREERSTRPSEAMSILVPDGGEPTPVVVSRMPMQRIRRVTFVLNNVNRWRGQMKLPPIAENELQGDIKTIAIGDDEATIVDLKGVFSPRPRTGMADAHGRSATSSPGAGEKATGDDRKPPVADRPIDFTAPAEWTAGPTSTFRVASFHIKGNNDQQALVTVIPLGREASDLRGNVDRWRGEIGLKPASDEELSRDVRVIEVAGIQSDLVHLVGPEDASPREATLGAIVRRGDRVWFFKMRGAAELVEREKDRFEKFVKSVKFKE